MDLAILLGVLFYITTLEQKRSFLSVENSILAKNIGTFCIILRHLIGQADGSIPLATFFCSNGFTFVGLFFLISGFGISYKNIAVGRDKRTIIRALACRIIKVMVPLITTALIMLMYYTIIGQPHKICLHNLEIAYTYVPYSWYIYTLILFYILATLCHLLSYRYAFVLQSIFILIYIATCYLGNDEINVCWYMSAACFGVGCILAYNNRLVLFMDKHKNIFICVSFAIYAFFYSLYNYPDKRSCVIQNFTSIGFALLMLLVLSNIDNNSRVQRIIGSISFELYLLQGVSSYIVIALCGRTSYLVLTFGTIAIDICLAIVMSKLNRFIDSRLKHILKLDR